MIESEAPCGHRLKIREDEEGKSIACPQCGREAVTPVYEGGDRVRLAAEFGGVPDTDWKIGAWMRRNLNGRNAYLAALAVVVVAVWGWRASHLFTGKGSSAQADCRRGRIFASRFGPATAW